MKNIHCLALLLCIDMACAAQQKNTETPASKTGSVWTNRISRVVKLDDTDLPLKPNLRSEANSNSLLRILNSAIMKRKLVAYGSIENGFNAPLNNIDIMYMFQCTIDSPMILDPATNKYTKRITYTEFNHDEIKKYKVLEEWTFDRDSSKTTVKIIGIAPVKEIYGESGALRGHLPFYWLRYTDVKGILDAYEQEHPNANINLAVWNDYFLPGN